jgi:hypothetical protein
MIVPGFRVNAQGEGCVYYELLWRITNFDFKKLPAVQKCKKIHSKTRNNSKEISLPNTSCQWMVGFNVGDNVGFVVGVKVGAVGAGVGVRVGLGVGDDVGVRVIPPHMRRKTL